MVREKTFSVRESDLSAGVPNVCLLWERRNAFGDLLVIYEIVSYNQ